MRRTWLENFAGDDSTMTYDAALAEVCRLANWLKSQGVQPGDSVSIYLPMVLELPIAMLACARIGAVHSVVFGGFSSESLADRMMDSKPKVCRVCAANFSACTLHNVTRVGQSMTRIL